MRIAFIILSFLVTFAHAQVTPERENVRRTGQDIRRELDQKYRHLAQVVVGSSSFDPATGQYPEPGQSSVPCVTLFYGSDRMAEQLQAIFGFERDGVPISYRYRRPGPDVAFAAGGEASDRMALAAEELAAELLERPGVVSIGRSAEGIATGVVVSVADPETERMLLEEYPPGFRRHEVPVIIARERPFDARDPVVTPPCEPALTNRGWTRFKHRVKKFFMRPVR